MKLIFAFLWLVRLLPIPVIQLLAFIIGRVAYFLAVNRRRVGMINMRLCFPDLSHKRQRQIIKGCFVNMACMILEYGICWYSSKKRIRQLVSVIDLHHLTDLYKAGEEIIVFYPHFTAFELGGFRLNQEIKMVSIYSHQKNAAFDEQIYKGRMRYNNMHLVSRQESLRSIIKIMLKNHASLIYLPDQDLGAKDSLFIKFFATDAATVPGLSRIARLSHAKVVPIIAYRIGFRFEIKCYPAWENFPTDDLVADTRRMNAFLEERILEHPEQYYWLHKRFKTRPNNEPRFY